MAREKDKAKRWWRPRFSVRALFVATALVGAYFASWEPTRNTGIGDVVLRYAEDDGSGQLVPFNVSSPMPLVVHLDQPHPSGDGYYFWFFGYVAKLPYEPRG